MLVIVNCIILCSARSLIPDTSGVYTDCGETDPGMCTTTLVNVSILTCPHNYGYHCSTSIAICLLVCFTIVCELQYL